MYHRNIGGRHCNRSADVRLIGLLSLGRPLGHEALAGATGEPWVELYHTAGETGLAQWQASV